MGSKKGLRTEKEYRAISNILMKLAVYFVENSLTGVAESEAKSFFVDYTDERNRELDGLELFESVLERSEIIVHNPFDQTIHFKHRSYCEFLYALNQRNNGQLEIGSEMLSPYWSTIYYFYFGLRSDCPDLIKQLKDVQPVGISERWSLVVNFPNYLMAASETKYADIVPIVEHITEQFVSLYLDSRDGKTPFPKGQLTKIQFLSLVTPFFQSVLGYRYFRMLLRKLY